MQQNAQEHQRKAERIETLLQEVAAFGDPCARTTTEELLQALLDMYGDALARTLELTVEYVQKQYPQASDDGLMEALAGDELVGSLLLLHGLHPVDIETRITRVLEDIGPYLTSQGSSVALIGIHNGSVHLRLESNSNGHSCPSSMATLKSAIEEAVYKAAPDLDELHIEGIGEPVPRTGIPVTFTPHRRKEQKKGDLNARAEL